MVGGHIESKHKLLNGNILKLNVRMKLSMVIHGCNPSTWNVEAIHLCVPGIPGLDTNLQYCLVISYNL